MLGTVQYGTAPYSTVQYSSSQGDPLVTLPTYCSVYCLRIHCGGLEDLGGRPLHVGWLSTGATVLPSVNCT